MHGTINLKFTLDNEPPNSRSGVLLEKLISSLCSFLLRSATVQLYWHHRRQQ